MTEKQEFADRFRKHYHEFITMEISFDDFCDKVFSEIDYQQQVSVEPVVMLNFADINKIIYEMIDEVKKGYYDISNTIDLAQYDKGYIKALENLKSKISA